MLQHYSSERGEREFDCFVLRVYVDFFGFSFFGKVERRQLNEPDAYLNIMKA